MDLDVLFWLVMAGIVAVAISSLGPPSAVATMWRYWGLLWPAGVQEDDDAQWSWARFARPVRPAPEVRDEAPPTERPDVPEGRYEVRSRVRYEVRSADRARS